MCSVGEVVHIWRRGLLGNQLCGCGLPFRECPFWTRVGNEAFGGWDMLDVDHLVRLQRQVDRNRYIPLMMLRRLSPGYRRALQAYTDVLARLYRAVQATSGAAVIVDSTKHASSGFLLRTVPGIDLRVLHLTRDSRGVAYSWTKEIRKPEITEQTEYMPRYHPGRMAFRWVAYNALFHLLRWTGTPVLFLRYEDFVARPRAQAERVMAFVGKRLSGNELAFIGEDRVVLGPTHTVAGNPMRFKQGDLTLRVDDQWRVKMDPVHRRTVGILTWPLMRLYGYPVREPG